MRRVVRASASAGSVPVAAMSVRLHREGAAVRGVAVQAVLVAQVASLAAGPVAAEAAGGRASLYPSDALSYANSTK